MRKGYVLDVGKVLDQEIGFRFHDAAGSQGTGHALFVHDVITVGLLVR